jgi:hypothetical protein
MQGLETSAVLLAGALLAWDFGRRWIAYRRGLLLEHARMSAFEKELAEHKRVHQKAIDNLIAEMREAVGEVKTRSSLALERANNAAQRRFGR